MTSPSPSPSPRRPRRTALRTLLLIVVAAISCSALTSVASASTVSTDTKTIGYSATFNGASIAVSSAVSNDYGHLVASASASTYKQWGFGRGFNSLRVELRLYDQYGRTLTSICSNSWTCKVYGPERNGLFYYSSSRFCGDYSDDGKPTSCTAWTNGPGLK